MKVMNKKIVFSVMALVLGSMCLTSCNDDDPITPDKGVKDEITGGITEEENQAGMVFTTFSASHDVDDATRTALQDGKDVVWQTGDKITVFNNGVGSSFTLDNTDAGKTSGNFSGYTYAEGNKYYALSPANTEATISGNKISGVVLNANQTAIEGTYDPDACIMTAYSETQNLEFKHACSFIKIQLGDISTDLKDLKSIVIKSKSTIAGTFDATIEEDGANKGIASISNITNGSKKIVLEPKTGEEFQSNATYYIAVFPGEMDGFEIHFETVQNSYRKTTTAKNTFNRAKIKNLGTYPTTWTETKKQEVIYGGEFTINAAGDKVRFSRGNLWAVMENATKVKEWKLADEQYSVIRNTSGNIRRSNCVDGDIVSLFNWVEKDKYSDGVKQYGIFSEKDYPSTGISEGATPSDWGKVYTENSETDYTWRVLTLNEWKYLLTGGATTAPSDGSGMRNQAYTACLALVNDVNGLIIFPDGFDASKFSSIGVSAPTAYAGVGQKSSNWNVKCSTNTYNLTDWNKLEQNGCMFLPAEGYMNGTSPSSPSDYGLYMSQDNAASATQTYLMRFGNGNPGQIYVTGNQVSPFYGRCVRLVSDITK